jgi:hypothetical protein
MASLLKFGAASAVATVLSLVTVQAIAENAEDDPDVYGYVGASYGTAKMKIEPSDTRFSEWDDSWKAFGGVMFNENIGAEFSYGDMGSPSAGGISVDEVITTSAQVIGVLPLGQFDLFAKIGYAYYDAEFEFAGGGTPTRNGIELASGVGARYNFGDFAIRAEAEAVDVEFADLYNVSLGLQYRF